MKLACLVSVLQLTSGNQIFASGKLLIRMKVLVLNARQNHRIFLDISVPVEFAGNENTPNLSRSRRQTDDAADAAAEEIVADAVAEIVAEAVGLTEGSGSTGEEETNPDPEGSSAGIMKASSAILGFILARIFA